MRTLHRFTFLIGLAFAALADGICGRKLAINAAEAPPAQGIQVGIPSGLSATAIAARMRALVAAGTPQLHAQAFAIDAEQQQAWHDNPKQRQGDQATAKTSAEQIAAGIRDAQKLDPTQKPKALTDKQLKERSDAVAKVEKAAVALAGAKKDDDRTALEETLAEARAALDAIYAEQA